MKRWIVLGVVAGGLAIAGCGRQTPIDGEGRLSASGAVTVTSVGDVTRGVRGTVNLRTGDVVRVTDGGATATVPGGSSLLLRDGTVVRFSQGPQLTEGDLLVSAPRRAVTVNGGNGSVAVQGVAKVRRDLALTVGTYQGNATLTSAGSTLAVPAYRQASAAALGLLPQQAAPFSVNADDLWDQKYLGPAIDLTTALEGASRGFTSEAPAGVATNAAFLKTAVAPLAHEASLSDVLITSSASAFNRARTPGELLIGGTIAAVGKNNSFGQRWDAVFAFRDEGAAWGLVVLDQGADPASVMQVVTAAINRSVPVAPPPVLAPGEANQLFDLPPKHATPTTVQRPHAAPPAVKPKPAGPPVSTPPVTTPKPPVPLPVPVPTTLLPGVAVTTPPVTSVLPSTVTSVVTPVVNTVGGVVGGVVHTVGGVVGGLLGGH